MPDSDELALRIDALEYHLGIKPNIPIFPITIELDKLKRFNLMTQEVVVKFEKTHPDAVIPETAYEGDACFDLMAVEDTIIPPSMIRPYRLGLNMPLAKEVMKLVAVCRGFLIGLSNGFASKCVLDVKKIEEGLKNFEAEHEAFEYDGVQIGKAFVPVGLRMELPMGWEAAFRTRSSFGVKQCLRIHPGTIDAGYRGDLMIAVYNMGSEPVLIKKGQGVAQVAIRPVPKVSIVEAPVDLNTSRGVKGFGSSDKV